MIPTYNNIHNRFKLNGRYYSLSDLSEVAYSFIKEGDDFEQEIGVFLNDWLDEKPYIITKTSGSTATPKLIEISKQAMVNSAIATGDFFNLKPGDTALHCLPVNFIAGRMMLVRAMILGLEIDVVKPATHLEFSTKKHYDFCAMVPMQLQKNMSNLQRIKTIIVGGAAISDALLLQIQSIKPYVYQTYGMTETVTHIALKKINHIKKTTPYKVLPGIKISQDDRECLVISAPKLQEESIVTNDVVILHSKTTFDWLGRIDNVINSGGVKLFPEQIETKLQKHISNRFFVSSKIDETLGNKLILIIEGKEKTLKPEVFKSLDAYEKPKQIFYTSKFEETKTGKIHRKKTLEKIDL